MTFDPTSSALGDTLRTTYINNLANDELDRLAKLAEEAIALFEPDQPADRPLFRDQPDYAAQMPHERIGSLLSAIGLTTMHAWLEGDEIERAAIDRRLERQNREWIEQRLREDRESV